jgi:DNA-binding MarR family transcriptional regulator
VVTVADESQRKIVPLSAEEEAFVRAFFRALLIVPRALDADLLTKQHMSVNEYNTLMHLSEAPDRRLRMSELAAISTLSLSGMTRIMNRLEALGLVQRERCASDGRGFEAVLTDAGLDRLREAWPTHLNSVRRHVLDHLQAVDLQAITTALQHFASDAQCDPERAQL